MDIKKIGAIVYTQLIPIAVIAMLFDFVVYYSILGYVFLHKHEVNILNIGLTIFCVLLTGAILFLLKCKYQKVYGILELIIACCNIFFFLVSESPEYERAYATLFSHLATFYIIVRGLENCIDKQKALDWANASVPKVKNF